jgi:uncharacterized protein (DUF433 family)/predicted nucleotidyltransferase
MNDQQLIERITLNPQILDAQPVIRGVQVLVEQILGMLATGKTFQSIMEQHPGLEQEDIQACLVYARQLVQREQAKRWQPRSLDDLQSAIPQILEQAPYIKLLVLFGSRARGDHNEKSDWDFAFLCDEELRKHYEKGGWDAYRTWRILQDAYHLGDDQIDVVDLKGCSDILAHSIARDGKVLYEQATGEFNRFRQNSLMSKKRLKIFEQKQRDQNTRSPQGSEIVKEFSPASIGNKLARMAIRVQPILFG